VLDLGSEKLYKNCGRKHIREEDFWNPSHRLEDDIKVDRKYERVWAVFIWLRIWTNSGVLVTTVVQHMAP
jgi:hypothetical protein